MIAVDTGRCVGGPRNGTIKKVENEKVRYLRLFTQMSPEIAHYGDTIDQEIQTVVYERDSYSDGHYRYLYWRWPEMTSDEALALILD